MGIGAGMCCCAGYLTHVRYENNSGLARIWERDRGANCEWLGELAGKLFTAGAAIDGHGVERWDPDGTLEQNYDAQSYRYECVLGPTGKLTASGTGVIPPEGGHVFVYESDGTVSDQWGDVITSSIGFDGGGNCYVQNGSGFQFGSQFEKWNSGHVRQYLLTYDTFPANNPGPWRVDSSGNVWAVYNNSFSQIKVKKWNSAGSLLWTQTYSQATYGDPTRMDLDGAGGLFLGMTGKSLHLDSSGAILTDFGFSARSVFCLAGEAYWLTGSLATTVTKTDASDGTLWSASRGTWGVTPGTFPLQINVTADSIYLGGLRSEVAS